jgi:hypothetical protein
MAIMSVLLVASVAFASPPSSDSASFPVKGSFTDVATVVSTTTSGGNTITHYSSVLTFTGTEVGTCAGPVTVVAHADGTFNFHGKCTFKGTVGGSGSGSAKYKFEGKGEGISFTGHLVGSRGTGGLSGLHLEHKFAGAFTSATTTAGTYSGHYHIDK